MKEKQRLLVVEDHETIVRILHLCLSDIFDIDVATTVAELESRLVESDEAKKYFAIVLDGRLGVDFTQPSDTLPFIPQCKTKARHVLASSADAPTRNLMVQAGCDAQCEKVMIHNHLINLHKEAGQTP